ncbi:hypothetical protein HanRHA438_Chr07g0310781 [Helianthus annuus]|uniref:Uncharacterized protein n=1 Tax=Helianthus annuus TaxID=4232 RepID=A0A251VJK8_HELAN|nr:hypothetical protein HanXRQr2_Chr07g0300641 [Helianthus annuus]KAJ0550578.1 hypothetical protein HanHA300_Chr07g0247031 [Helianthus annuus]KAJ0557356.1 hypothetical protein HanIR_Chr07g0324261 [Helianthus annuus]KAJ0563547.1 hypothetical protein HanHA89_Chr07g0264391 [Helianthus annuus]KAJ0728877.1 hypothetical protein HanLR1_Chr07g0246671 [Helianthus annuus]
MSCVYICLTHVGLRYRQRSREREAELPAEHGGDGSVHCDDHSPSDHHQSTLP